MDDDHLLAAFRHVALNPVNAGLAARAGDWPWSSARAHIARQDTPYVDVAPALARIDDFAAFVAADQDDEATWSEVLEAELIGRPVGTKAWVESLEKQLGRSLSPQKRGRKPRGEKAGHNTELSGN